MRGALPVFQDTDELRTSALSGDWGIKKRGSKCTFDTCRALRNAPNKWRPNDNSSGADTPGGRGPSRYDGGVTFILWTWCSIEELCVCVCLKTSVWRNGLEVLLKCASRRKHGVVHHNYKNGRKEKLLSGRNFFDISIWTNCCVLQGVIVSA